MILLVAIAFTLALAAPVRAEPQDSALAELDAALAPFAARETSTLSAAEIERVVALRLARAERRVVRARENAANAAEPEAARADLDLVFALAARDSPVATRAHVTRGELELLSGDARTALEHFAAALDAAFPTAPATWNELDAAMSAAERRSRFTLVQLALPGLVAAASGSADCAVAARAATLYVDALERQQLAPSATLGPRATIAAARALFDCGGALALESGDARAHWFASRDLAAAAGASDVRDAHRVALGLVEPLALDARDFAVAREARDLATKISLDHDVPLPGALALVCGRQEIATGRPELALHLLNLSAGDPELAGELHGLRGDAQRAVGLESDAAASFEKALAAGTSDIEEARRYARVLLELLRVNEADAARMARAEDRAIDLGGELAGETALARGEKLAAERRFELARSAFERVPADASQHDFARLRGAECALELASPEEAVKELDELLAALAERRDAPPSARSTRIAARATFQRGRAKQLAAELGHGTWEDVLATLDGFFARFPDEPELAAAALARCIEAELALGQLERADKRLSEAARDFPASPWTARAAKLAYGRLRSARAPANDPRRERELLSAMARTLRIATAALEQPAIDDLRLLSRHQIDLEDWAGAETTLRALFARAGEPGSGLEPVALSVDLARALLRAGKPADAVALLRPLVARGVASRAVRTDLARALGGWIALDGTGAVIAGPGLGGTDAFAEAVRLLEAEVRAAQAWTAPWYEAESALIRVLESWGELDRARRGQARQHADYLVREVGARFDHPSVPTALRALLAAQAERLAR